MFGREDFIKADEFGVIFFILIADDISEFRQIKPGKLDRFIKIFYEWFCYFILEKVSFGS